MAGRSARSTPSVTVRGFRKIRKELGVTAFGINAIIFPPGYGGPLHFHDEQEETYFVHRARSSSSSATARSTWSGPAASPETTAHRARLRNVGDTDAVCHRRGQGRLCRAGRPGAGRRDQSHSNGAEDDTINHTGGCVCGGVRYEVTEPFVSSNYCHCTRCQRRTGTAASANGRTRRARSGSSRARTGQGLEPPAAASRSASAPTAARRCSAATPRRGRSSASAWAPSTATRASGPRAPVHRLRRLLGAAPRRRPAALSRSPRGAHDA